MVTAISGSNSEVGSSKSINCGSTTRARAMATRFCMPPESSSGMRSSTPCRPTASSLRGDDGGDFLRRVESVFGEVKADIFADRQRGEQGAGLKDHGHAVFVPDVGSMQSDSPWMRISPRVGLAAGR